MQTLTLADDVLSHNFDGISPSTNFERDVLAGEVLARVEAVRLGHDVFRLFRAAAFLRDDRTIVKRYPPSKIWGLDIEKVAAYLTRVLDTGFTKETRCLTWANTMNDLRAACDALDGSDSTDVAVRLRRSVEASLQSTLELPSLRAEAWGSFQMALLILGPIFSGEVTRADLSA